MNFEELQHLARLYVVGALDEDETAMFERGRKQWGDAADEFIHDCRNLNSAFALSLRPKAPRTDAKSRLMSLISASGGGKQTLRGGFESGSRF